MSSCPYHALERAGAPAEASAAPAGMRRLTFYRLLEEAPRIVPGRAARAWMDATPERYAYRCLPLSIANAMGWEILAPCRVDAEWNGGTEPEDLKVEVEEPAWVPRQLASSHFGRGILTFHVGYLLRTEPGVGVWARGAPNLPKDGIAALEGIVETDWLPFSFTMNWQMTRPGRIGFAKDEPICFVTPLVYRALEGLVPEIVPITADPDLYSAYRAWKTARTEFNAGLLADDPETLRQGWQKWYMRGETQTQEKGNPAHLSKLTLAEPVARSGDEARRGG